MRTALLLLALVLAGCGSTITTIGAIGPNHVYLVKHNDFLSASRLLVIVNESGVVVGAAGGTVTGSGTLSLQTAGSVLQAGAVVYGATELATALQHAHVTETGRVTVTTPMLQGTSR